LVTSNLESGDHDQISCPTRDFKGHGNNILPCFRFSHGVATVSESLGPSMHEDFRTNMMRSTATRKWQE
jgi:hypothetical protein